MIQCRQTVCSSSFGLQNRLVENCQYERVLKARQMKSEYRILCKDSIHHGRWQNNHSKIDNNIDTEKKKK